MTKGFQPRTSSCKDKKGRLIMTDEEVLERWAEYFVELLNVDEREERNEGATSMHMNMNVNISMNMNINPEGNKPLLEEAIKCQRNRSSHRKRRHSQIYKVTKAGLAGTCRENEREENSQKTLAYEWDGEEKTRKTEKDIECGGEFEDYEDYWIARARRNEETL